MASTPKLRVVSLGVGLLLTALTGLVAMTVADDDVPPNRPPSASR